MMQPTHSLLFPPSSAEKRLNCFGSGYAELEMPDLFSQPAEEGTGAHMHSEACFNLNCDALRFLGCEFNHIEVTREQCEYVQMYVDLIRDRPGDNRFIELRLSLPEISEQLYGTLDSGVYDSITKTLYVDDLKYGYSLVTVERNGPLWVYALMFLVFLKSQGLAVDHVQLGIVQPRIGDLVETKLISAVQLRDWGEDVLRPAVKAVLDPNSPRTPGEHCKHCKAKMTCPEYLSWCGYVIQPPFTMSDERIATVLQWEKTAKQLISDAKAYGTERQQRGFHIPGCKLVKNRKHRQVKDKDELPFAMLIAGAEEKQMFDYPEPVLKSPAQLEKSIDKKLHPQLKEHFYTPEGGSTIALMDDSRVAVATTQEKFKHG